MRAEEKHLIFDSTLWVQYGGVRATTRGAETAVEAVEEDAFVKVLNHFGRALKLYLFADGEWVDGETGAPPAPFDASLAGRIEPAPARGASAKTPAAPPAKETAARPARRTRAAAPGGAKQAAGARAKRPAAPTSKSKPKPAKTPAQEKAAPPARRARRAPEGN